MQQFELADEDGSGGLDQEEFVQAFLNVPAWGIQSEEQLMHMFMKIDANSDGTVRNLLFTTVQTTDLRSRDSVSKPKHERFLSSRNVRFVFREPVREFA